MPSPKSSVPYVAPVENSRRVFTAVLFGAALVGVPAAIIVGGSWFEVPRAVPGDTRPLPEWVNPGDVRANTRDGTLVKVRVALDAGTSSNKSAVRQRLREIGQVLEVSVGDRKTSDLYGSQGIQQLSSDMLARVNNYLDAEGIDRLNGVAIQDLWYTRPDS